MSKSDPPNYVPQNTPKPQKGCFIGVLIINIPLCLCSIVWLTDFVTDWSERTLQKAFRKNAVMFA